MTQRIVSLTAGLLGLALFTVGLRAEIRTWTNDAGRSMEAEAVAINKDTVRFRKADGTTYDYPRAHLSPDDRKRLDAMVFELPILDTTKPAAGTSPAAAHTPKLTRELDGKLVQLKNGSLGDFDDTRLNGVKYYGIYFSAGWCGPCRQFSPKLVTAYKELKVAHPEFELVFVSNDRNERDMEKYMSEESMPWPAVRFKKTGSVSMLSSYEEDGIPNLVLVDAEGKVLATSFVKGEYVGPQEVLKSIRETLEKAPKS